MQQTLEIIGQTTKSNIDQKPQEMLKIKLVILELYKQVTWYLFELEADENRHTGVVTPHPELRQDVKKKPGEQYGTLLRSSTGKKINLKKSR